MLVPLARTAAFSLAGLCGGTARLSPASAWRHRSFRCLLIRTATWGWGFRVLHFDCRSLERARASRCGQTRTTCAATTTTCGLSRRAWRRHSTGARARARQPCVAPRPSSRARHSSSNPYTMAASCSGGCACGYYVAHVWRAALCERRGHGPTKGARGEPSCFAVG